MKTKLYAYLVTAQKGKKYWDDVYWAADEEDLKEQVSQKYPDSKILAFQKLETIDPIRGKE